MLKGVNRFLRFSKSGAQKIVKCIYSSVFKP